MTARVSDVIGPRRCTGSNAPTDAVIPALHTTSESSGATKENIAHFETQRAHLEANNLEHKKEAEAVATKLEGKVFVAIRSAGDTGQLYGSVSTRDIAEAVTAGGFTVDRRQIVLERPIKTLGLHDTKVQLHPEVVETFQQQIPMGHYGDPTDLGPLAVYLASDASRYMTGAALVIDGGYTLW